MMRTSMEGRALIQSFEKCRLQAYWDEAGKRWTIGWGRARNVAANEIWTQEQADAALVDDLADVETVLGNCGLELSQNQFDALVSFCYNVGFGESGVKGGFLNLASGDPSTLYLLLLEKNYARAADELLKWIHTPGAENGLLARRTAERTLFLKEA